MGVVNLFERVQSIVSVNITELIERHEDPRKMLRQLTQDCRSAIVEMERSVAQAHAQEVAYRDEAEKWSKRAESADKAARNALLDANDNKAREFLEARENYLNRSIESNQRYELQRQSVETYRSDLKNLREKAHNYDMEYQSLLVRDRHAEACLGFTKVESVFNDDSATGTLERARMSVREKESLVEIQSDGLRDRASQRSLDAEINEYARKGQSRTVDFHLEQLKKEMEQSSQIK